MSVFFSNRKQPLSLVATCQVRKKFGVFILGIASSNAADQSNICTCNHISQFNGLLSFMGCSFITKERSMNNLNNADIDVLMLQNFEFNWFLHYGRSFSYDFAKGN